MSDAKQAIYVPSSPSSSDESDDEEKKVSPKNRTLTVSDVLAWSSPEASNAASVQSEKPAWSSPEASNAASVQSEKTHFDPEDDHKFVLHGKPESMPRPTFMNWTDKDGKAQRRVVNKKKPKLEQDRDILIDNLLDKYQIIRSDFPLFPTEPVKVSMYFCRPLTKHCFFPPNNRQGTHRHQDNIKPKYLLGHHCDTSVPDIDNMSKYVLDLINGVFFTDDKQVVETRSFKMLDTEPPYEGKTVVIVSTVDPNKQWKFLDIDLQQVHRQMKVAENRHL